MSRGGIPRGYIRMALGAMLGMLVGACFSGTAGTSPSTAVRGREPLPAPSIVIEALRIRDEGDTAVLEVVANAPLVWTSYRNAGGDFVLELVDAVPGPDAVALTPAGSLIERVSVDLQDMLRRSPHADSAPSKRMTRMTIFTRVETVHALRSTAQALRLTFTPVPNAPPRERLNAGTSPPPAIVVDDPIKEEDLARTTIEGEDLDSESIDPAPVSPPSTPPPSTPPPIAAPAPTAPPTPPPVTAAPPTTTPAPAPALEPAPVGRRLLGARLEDGPYGPVVRLISDGSLIPRPFRLTAPARFVLDFTGVELDTDDRTLAVGRGGIAQVRLGQFQQQPPIARVVLDLDMASAEPRMETVDDGLIIHLSTDR